MNNYIFGILCTLFLLYTINIYNLPSKVEKVKLQDTLALKGQLIWQKYNCQSCHQIYGLGGYLGPDLTNVYLEKGENVIRAITQVGTNQMPAFKMDSLEANQLIAFFKSLDKSGSYKIRNFKILSNGMTQYEHR